MEADGTDPGRNPAPGHRCVSSAPGASGNSHILCGCTLVIRSVLPYDDCTLLPVSGMRNDPCGISGFVRPLGGSVEAAAFGIWLDHTCPFIRSESLSAG